MGEGPRNNLIHFVSDEVLAQVVRELSELERKSHLDLWCARGALILERCYGGSVDRWKTQSNRKTDSLRRLADRPDCRWKRSTLHRSVGVYQACRRLPEITRLPGISPSHIVCVLKLSDAEALRLLRAAGDHHWSVRRLDREVVRHRRQHHDERRGAPKATPARLATTRTRRAVRELEGLHTLVAKVESMDVEAAVAIDSMLDELADVIRSLKARLAHVSAAAATS